MKKMIISLLTGVLMAAMLLSGCGADSGETAAVQSVAMLAGLGNVGLAEQFGGVVTAQSEVKVKNDPQKTIKEVLVAEGDEVTKGQILFTYDMELARIDMEKAELELALLQNSLETRQKELTNLEKEKAKAKAEDQLEYSLAIQECNADIIEYEYKIAEKEQDVDRLRTSLEEQDCKSTVDGRVQKIKDQNDSSGYDYSDGSEDAFITIIQSGAYRVKGYINENNISKLYAGLQVTICSRVSDETWSGEVTDIDRNNPQSSGSMDGMYYYDQGNEMTTSSKYPFYISLDDSEGLLLGQHVYIKPAIEDAEGEEIIAVPEYYFFDVEGETAYVWAENAKGKLEKRQVSVIYLSDAGLYQMTEGLTADDYIAFPDENLKEGMTCEEFDDVVPDYGGDEGGIYDDGMYEEGIEYEEDQIIPEGEMIPDGAFVPEGEMVPAEGEEFPEDIGEIPESGEIGSPDAVEGN